MLCIAVHVKSSTTKNPHGVLPMNTDGLKGQRANKRQKHRSILFAGIFGGGFFAPPAVSDMSMKHLGVAESDSVAG